MARNAGLIRIYTEECAAQSLGIEIFYAVDLFHEIGAARHWLHFEGIAVNHMLECVRNCD